MWIRLGELWAVYDYAGAEDDHFCKVIFTNQDFNFKKLNENFILHKITFVSLYFRLSIFADKNTTGNSSEPINAPCRTVHDMCTVGGTRISLAIIDLPVGTKSLLPTVVIIVQNVGGTPDHEKRVHAPLYNTHALWLLLLLLHYYYCTRLFVLVSLVLTPSLNRSPAHPVLPVLLRRSRPGRRGVFIAWRARYCFSRARTSLSFSEIRSINNILENCAAAYERRIGRTEWSKRVGYDRRVRVYVWWMLNNITRARTVLYYYIVLATEPPPYTCIYGVMCIERYIFIRLCSGK